MQEHIGDPVPAVALWNRSFRAHEPLPSGPSPRKEVGRDEAPRSKARTRTGHDDGWW